ncbi:hypothetical protein ACFVDI_03240 [Nocardioides sp. NPDC057767]|uniref:hypothetical protein n=1 Tax=unclassified Nocardioides TaxID=2615069 RepID=UPI00367023A6
MSRDLGWQRLHRAGAVSAGLAVVLYVAALVIFAVVAPPPTSGGAAMLEYVDAHRTVYIVRQVLWLAPSLLLMVVFLALAVALRHLDKSFAAIAGMISVASWAVSSAWPTTGDGSLAMVLLSDEYAAATTSAAQAPFVAGAEVLIALNDVPAVIGVLQTLGLLLISLLMLKAESWRGLAWLGVSTGVVGVLSEVLRPVLGWAYALYGVLLFVWLIWTAIALWRLSTGEPRIGGEADGL